MLSGMVEGRRRVPDEIAVLPRARPLQRFERGRDAATLVLADEMTALAERAAHVGQDRVGLVARFDEESRADVGLGVLERLLDHALHVGLGQAVRRLHLDRRGLTGALLPG